MLGSHTRGIKTFDDLVGGVVAQPASRGPVVAVPIAGDALTGQFDEGRIFCDGLTISLAIQLVDMFSNGEMDLSDVLAEELNDEWRNPG
jgi:hypothetical protein